MSLELAIKSCKIDEGFRGYPYRCPAGAWTIAFGRNLDAKPLTEVEGEFLLRRDLIECFVDLHEIFGADIMAKMGLWRKAALANMRYQLGPGGFRGFKRMILAIKEDDWQWAAAEAADSDWAQQTPNRAERVVTAIAEDKDTWTHGGRS